MDDDLRPRLAAVGLFASSWRQKFFSAMLHNEVIVRLPLILPHVSTRFLSDEKGATAIEYGLLCALVFLVALGAMVLFATKATTMWTMISVHV